MSPPQQVELSITTQSQKIGGRPYPPTVLPKITMNGVAIPAPTSGSALPCGWQLVVINAYQDMTNPASIISNRYSSFSAPDNLWSSTYQYMYRNLVRQALLSGNTQQQLIIAVSYGLDRNMPPSNDGLEMLIEYGAGPQLQDWENHCNPGSQAGSSNQLVAMPANYILVGYSSHSYGQGTEKFEHGDPVQSNLTVTLRNPVPPSDAT